MSTTSRPSKVVVPGNSLPEVGFQAEDLDLRSRAAALRARIVELKSRDGTDQQHRPSRIASSALHSAEVSDETTACAAWEGGAIAAEQVGTARRAMRRVMPSWMISAVVHCLLLIVLAVLTFEVREFFPSVLITGGQSEQETVSVLTSPLRTQSPPEEFVSASPSDDDSDPGLPEFGAIGPELSSDAPISFKGERVFGDPLGSATTLDGAGGSSLLDGQAGAQFFGVQAGGNDFVFIVDSSTSMRLKFADALRELEYSLRGLVPSQRFYVIFFDRNAERLTLGKWNKRHTKYSLKLRPEPGMVSATEENLDGCVRWMHTIQLEQWTNPHTAMAFALNELRPDAIFLLSDGEFTDRGLTEQFLEEENSFSDPRTGPRPKVIIHCIGFYSREGEVTLKRIADTYGGTYRFVEPPPGYIPPVPRFPGRGFTVR